MCIHEDLITIIFRLSNFGLLTFFGVCFFKRYALPSILERMRQERDEFQKMRDRHKELDKQERNLEVAAQEQADFVRLLKERVVRWQHVEQVSLQKQLQDRERLALLYDERMAYQAQACAQQNVLRTMIPRIVTHVEKDLTERYANTRQNQQYIADILARCTGEKR